MSFTGCPFTRATCTASIYLDWPLIERVQHRYGAGFAAEPGWGRAHRDRTLCDTGATFTSLKASISGNLAQALKSRGLLDSAARSLEAAETIDCANRIIDGTGLGEGSIPVEVVTPAIRLAAGRCAGAGQGNRQPISAH